MTLKIAKVHTDDRLINQLQQNISSAIDPIFQNLSGSFLVQMTGITTTVLALANWQRPTSSGPVTLILPSGLSGTSNSVSLALIGLPASLFPSSLQRFFVRITNNGTTQLGLCEIDVNGGINFSVGAAGSAFTASGTKEISRQTVTYATGI